MSYSSTIFRVILVALGLLVLSPEVAYYFLFWQPNQRFADEYWLFNAAVEERRRVSHQVLLFPKGNHHDAFLMLAECGDKTSVPYLINALKWQRETKPGDAMVCTKGHCLGALAKITGQDLGSNYDDWRAYDGITDGRSR